jgi:hypothetical protein
MKEQFGISTEGMPGFIDGQNNFPPTFGHLPLKITCTWKPPQPLFIAGFISLGGGIPSWLPFLVPVRKNRKKNRMKTTPWHARFHWPQNNSYVCFVYDLCYRTSQATHPLPPHPSPLLYAGFAPVSMVYTFFFRISVVCVHCHYVFFISIFMYSVYVIISDSTLGACWSGRWWTRLCERLLSNLLKQIINN